jgi:hypothetical protein
MLTNHRTGKRSFLALLLVLLLVIVSACVAQPIEQAPAAPESPLAVAPESPLLTAGVVFLEELPELAESPELAEGTGAVRGRLFSSITNDVIDSQAVFLPSFLCGPDAVPDDPERTGCFWMFDTNQSPTSFTDETGYFIFLDLEPGEYLLFVGDLTWDYAFYETDGERPIPFVVEEGEVTELGNLILAFPY